MSEISKHMESRRKALLAFCSGMLKGEKGVELIEKYKSSIEKVTPEDTVAVIDSLIKAGHPMDDLKKSINKILNVFYKYLSAYNWEKPNQDHFLFYLMLENYHLKDRLSKLRPSIKEINKQTGNKQYKAIQKVREGLEEIKKFDIHYQKKENILFPYFEKHFSEHRCLQVMWSMHDDIRNHQKDLYGILSADEFDLKTFNKSIADLFFAMHAIVFREEKILFQVSMLKIPEADWEQMHQQSFEIGFVFIDPPTTKESTIEKTNMKDGLLDMGTGRMTVNQLIHVMNHLPIDMTFVDHNNEVAYFSNPKDRFFTRSKAIIGRKVHNCHPPESVHIVREIITSFKSGIKDKASFWLTIKDKFLLIQYFAVRSDAGNYIGTLEVTQDISEIKKLEGEQRLLDWNIV